MFTLSDLSDLSADQPPLGISIFLPTHVRGAEIRQGTIRLKNLLAQARGELSAADMDTSEIDALLAPAVELVEDYAFWQYQDLGLALFLGGGGLRSFQVPLPLVEQVVVGPGFHPKPLLPLLAADGAFRVLTLTADQVKLFTGSRFALTEDDSIQLPDSVDDVSAESDYQNPVQASPVARPNTGSVNIGNAQVYGDSPPEWRKSQLVDFTRQVAAAIDTATARQRLPVILVADAELGGHFHRASNLGPLLAGVIETNPDTLDQTELHDAAYQVVQPRLDEVRQEAIERFATLQGRHDPRAITQVDEVVKAAYRGQVDTMLLRLNPAVWGRYDVAADQVVIDAPATSASADLYQKAALLTLAYGGDVHLLDPSDLSDLDHGAAILRF